MELKTIEDVLARLEKEEAEWNQEAEEQVGKRKWQAKGYADGLNRAREILEAMAASKTP